MTDIIDIDKIQNEISDLRQKILQYEIEIDEIIDEIDDLEGDKLKLENELTAANNKIERLTKTIELNLPANEKPSYYAKKFLSDNRPALLGQFPYNDKWCVCNGYVLILSNNKFEGIEESAGLGTELINKINTLDGKEKTDFTFRPEWFKASDNSNELQNEIKISGSYFNHFYLQKINCLFNLENNPYTVYVNPTKATEPMIIVCDFGRAIVLPIRKIN